MSRLALLVALLLAAVTPVAHAGSVARGGPTASVAQAGPQPDRDGDGVPDQYDKCPDQAGGYGGCPDTDGDGFPDQSDACPNAPGPNTQNGCPAPADSDHDGVPDASDACPNEPGAGGGGQSATTPAGCPEPPDGDGDGVPDASDKCPTTYAKTATGCDPFLWKYFFSTQTLKDFVANKSANNSWCRGLPDYCKTTHVTFTLSAATARQAGIANPLISSLQIAMKGPGFVHTDISRADQAKLGRLKKLVVTIRAWVVLSNGKKVESAPKTVTIVGKLFVSHVASSDPKNTTY